MMSFRPLLSGPRQPSMTPDMRHLIVGDAVLGRGGDDRMGTPVEPASNRDVLMSAHAT